ncbi:MAG: hypothetical protein ABI832_05325 [bacterium]
MVTVRTAVLACLVLAACDGNPFDSTAAGGGGSGGGSSSTSASTLPGTTTPSASGSVVRFEDHGKGPNVNGGAPDVTGNGFAFKNGKINYDSGKDTFTVDNLAFDGGNVYTRSTTVPTLGPAQVYEASATYADSQTHAQIDQFSYRALYGVSTSGRTRFGIVRTGSYAPYGFGGFIYTRNGGVTLPTTGQAKYTGTYAGLRDFNGSGGLQLTSGDMEMAIDFNDFNPDESFTGNGAGIQGQISNRHIYDLNGNDITATVLDGINTDKNLAVPLTALPSLVFKVGPGVLDNNGEAEGQLNDTIDVSGGPQEFEAGKYYAVISGKNADEVAGVIVITSSIGSVTARETGGFILYRP